MILEITQDDCDNGKKGLGRECPTALALIRQLGLKEGDVHVGTDKIFIFDSGWSGGDFRSPKRLMRMIDQYDHCAPFKPGRYAIFRA